MRLNKFITNNLKTRLNTKQKENYEKNQLKKQKQKTTFINKPHY